MPSLEFPRIRLGMSNDELANMMAKAFKDMEWLLNGNVDSFNVRNIAGYKVGRNVLMHESGIVGMNGADPKNGDAIRFWSGDADPTQASFRVTQAGILTAVAALFMSALGYPRVELNSDNNLFGAFLTATNSIEIKPNVLGSPLITFDNGTISGSIGNTTTRFWIQVTQGVMLISANNDIEISSGSQVKYQSWSKIYSTGNGETLQNALDDLQSGIDGVGSSGGASTVMNSNLTSNRAVVSSGSGKISTSSTTSTQIGYLSTVTSDVQSQIDGKASKTLPSWTAPVLQNSWVNYGGAYQASGYYKDDMGIVRFKGLIRNGLGTAGTTLFTLPVGNRPLSDLVFNCISNNGGVATPIAIEVSSLGVVKISSFNAGTTWLALDGISFRAEQ